MKCAEVQDKLLDLLDNNLDQADNVQLRIHVEQHVEQCPTCSAEWKSLALACRNLCNLDDADADSACVSPSQIYARFENRLMQQKRRWKWSTAIAASVAVLISAAAFSLANIEVTDSRVTISWQPDTKSAVPIVSEDIQSKVASYEQRLRDIDTLIHLIANELESGDRKLEQVNLALANWIRKTESLENERWKTVMRGMHNLHLTSLSRSPIEIDSDFQQE